MTKGFAVAASDVGGAFVKDLATELGKSASTLAAYLRKHLPTTLVKRKNANNRLANFCTADGVAGLRAHYTPTYAEVPNALVEELERLRAENERLRARVEELESVGEQKPKKMTDVDFSFDRARARVSNSLEDLSTPDLLKYTDKLVTDVSKTYGIPRPNTRLRDTIDYDDCILSIDASDELGLQCKIENENMRRRSYGLAPLTEETYKQTLEGKDNGRLQRVFGTIERARNEQSRATKTKRSFRNTESKVVAFERRDSTKV